MRLVLPISLVFAALLLPSTVMARPFSLQPDDKPWSSGTLMPSFGLGGSFSRGGGGNLLVAGGVSYFLVNNLALGMQLRNFTTFLPSSYKRDFPGIEKSIPTNEFSMIPGLTVMLFRSYGFTPYIHAGVGPVFLNHKRGVLGEWNAGPGFLIGLGRRIAVDLGVTFSMRFPGEKCQDAFTYNGPTTVIFNACGLRWGIRAGLVFGFGVGRKRNPPPQPPPESYPPPPPQPQPSPAPYAPPSYEPPPAYESPAYEPPAHDPPAYDPQPAYEPAPAPQDVPPEATSPGYGNDPSTTSPTTPPAEPEGLPLTTPPPGE